MHQLKTNGTMANKHNSTHFKRCKAIHHKIDTELLAILLKEFIDSVARLESLQAHRRFCVESVSFLTSEEQQVLRSKGFYFVSLANYVQKNLKLHTVICDQAYKVVVLYKNVVKGHKLLKTSVPENLKDTVEYVF